MTARPATVRAKPIRLARVGYVAAVVFVAVFVAVALVQKKDNAGAYFASSDQIGTVLIGVILGALCLVLARPRLVADDSEVRMRGFFGGWRAVPWDVVVRVEFPRRVRCARLVLPGEETFVLYAVQRVDKQQAVEVMRGLRELFAVSHPQR